MTLTPILTLPPIIQLHACAALIALCIGPFALWRTTRDRVHKWLGYLWVASMAVAAVSSFGIASHFSPVGIGPIHLLSAYGLSGLWLGLRAIYRRDVALHAQIMENVYVRGVVLAGAFQLLPGRSFARALIPDVPVLGYVVIGAVLIWAFVPLVARGKARRTVQL